MAYKHVIRANTKNLFDISKAAITERDYYFVLTQGATSNFYAMTVTPDTTYTVSYEIFVDKNDTGAPSALELSIQTGTKYKDGTQLYIKTAKNTGIWERHSGQFTVPSDVSQVTFSGLRDRFLYRNFMVELSSTATPYTPYNYLQSNKRMIKVSNVCQLLDKSKVESNTINGLTFTNNKDGTWVVNGTSTAPAWSNNLIPDSKSYNLFGHKLLLMRISDDDNIVMEFKYVRKDGTGYGFNYFKENIFTLTEIENYDSFQVRLITLKTGVTFTNTQATPQLFDLTEMFGAGHEPATVAEFRQKFPDELYPYSPQCWLTSYQSAVVYKTKNLFDVNNAVPYTLHNENPPSNRISLKDGIYTSTCNNYNVGTGLRIKNGLVLSPGTYTLSLNIITVGETNPITGLTYGFELYKSDGTKPVLVTYTEVRSSRVSHAFTIPTDCTDIRLYLSPHCQNGQNYVYISLKDIQLEQGSTATSYVPYQHL